ncbi:START domain-containing protein [Sporobolomyces koalae]|uniref:START domain-containing protein n=1 Tax=Sporobolomyces koalae TaxID=500713 RepID=UPI0031752AB4
MASKLRRASRALSIKSSKSTKSEYDYDSQFGNDDYDDDASVSSPANDSDGFDDLGRRPSAMSDSSAFSVESYLTSAARAMSKLQDLHSAPDSSWKKALTHKKSGTQVYVSKDKSYVSAGKGNKGFYAPVFKSVLDVDGFAPSAVFGVVGTRKLWDEWYKEGSLVENLSEDSSLTYMCMKGIAGSSTRDLSLVEKVQGSPTGVICFATTSVVTPKVPRVAGRVRASIALNGWVLEPTSGGTRISYYLHVNVKTFMPSFAATKYLARRPTCISRIASYLHSHGAPPMMPVDPEPTPSVLVPSATSSGSSLRRRDSVSSKRSTRSGASTAATTVSSGSGAVGLPSHVELVRDAASFEEIQTAIKLFRATLDSAGGQGWTVANDPTGTKIVMKMRGEGEVPIVKGEADVGGGVTTEQALATITSSMARILWDPRLAGIDRVELHNGYDQGLYVESQKGIFPSIKPFHYTVAQGIDRDDPADSNGPILLVSRSTRNSERGPKGSSSAKTDFTGFLLTPSSRGVRITHIAQRDVGGQKLGFATQKILSTELARAPLNVARFIDANGFAPHFLRWGNGPAELIRDTAPGDDFAKGKVTFVIGGEGKGTMKDGKQKCWLSWSEKMYPRGINLVLEPADAGDIAKVETVDGTMVEICWTEKIKQTGDQGARLILSRADGDGSEDVYVGGEFLDKTVKGEPGAMRKKPVQRKPTDDPVSSDQKREAAAIGAIGGGVAAGAAAAGLAATKSKDTPPTGTASDSGASKVTREMEPSNTSAVKASPGSVPSNACLIITQDLYFTQQQVLVMIALVLGAYVWGKLA